MGLDSSKTPPVVPSTSSWSDPLQSTNTASLALLTLLTSLLQDSKHFFLIQRKGFKLPVLASIFTGNFLAYYLELYNIVTFLFLTLKLNWQ